MTMHTLRFLIEKEVLQFIRNPFLPKMTVMFPLLVMLIIPWVTTMDVRHVNIAVVDCDHTAASRRLTEKIGASEYFTLHSTCGHYAPALEALEQGDVDVIIEVPDGFERSITEGAPLKTSISANGVNAVKGSLGMQYINRLLAMTLAELGAERGVEIPDDSIIVRNLYNPTLDYRFYMIPALMIMLVVMMCGFLPALNLVSEKETGTIEQINVTPTNRFTFTLAKLIPYWAIGLIVITLAMLLSWLVYGLVPAGSIWAIYLAAVLFILTMSGVGVIAANYSQTLQQTMFVMFFFVMIFILMSGLVTPVDSMPAWAKAITWALPPRYFIDIMRSVYLKGAHLTDLTFNYVALALFATAFNLWAALSYKKQA